MFSSLEYAIKWASEVLGYRAVSYVPRNADDTLKPIKDKKFCVVNRTGGELNYPHDSPSFAFQLWCRTDAEAEEEANILAIAAKLKPMKDIHVNAVGVPDVLSYGYAEDGWFIWQVNIDLEVNLLD